MTRAPDLIEVAEAAWGTPLPDWVRALALQCQLTSQAAVARKLDRSPAVISTVLRKTYTADTSRIEERVRGVFLDGKVICPALGDLPTQECQDWRAKAATFASGNPLRTRMFRACRKCPINMKEAEA